MSTDIKHPVPDWHRMLYSCTHTATMGVKGLTNVRFSQFTVIYTDCRLAYKPAELASIVYGRYHVIRPS